MNDLISKLSEMRSNYNCFDETEEPYYRALSEAIQLASAQQQYEPVTAEDFAKTMSENSLYGYMAWHGEAFTLMNEMGFVICKKTM